MRHYRRNIDEPLRRLQRAALEGDPAAQEAYYRAVLRTKDCALIGEALFAMGPELATQVLTPPKRFKGPQRHEERDTQAICLGQHLVQLGYLPDIPVRTYSSPGPYGTGGFTEHMQSTKPKWIPLPASVRGRARRRRFLATYGFGYMRAWGNEEGGDRQGPTFYFKLEPLGKHYGAEQYVRGLGVDEAARRIAPGVRFLARWDRSSVVNRSWASGQRLDVAGGTDMYWLVNNIYAYSRSDPARESDQYEDPDQSWDLFLRGSRAGRIPGDPLPPRAPAWSDQKVEAWLRNPERNDALRALFYADLWLAGLLVPGEDVGYDPITGGPAVQTNPPWRLNADPRLRMAQRRAATEQGTEALAALYHERMRVGDLHPADLWLAARIPPYNTCLAEVHEAAELAFGEEIPFSSSNEPMGVFYWDLPHEANAGLSIPIERLRRRLRAMNWLARHASTLANRPQTLDLNWGILELNRRYRQGQAEGLRIYEVLTAQQAGRIHRMLFTPPYHGQALGSDGYKRLMGNLQAYLLRSPQ